VTDPRKLGKRGSYRLGRLGAPSAPRVPWPTAHYPSFAPQRRGPATAWLLACLAGTVVMAAGALAGWWFLPFLAGLAAGLAVRFGRLRLRTALAGAVAVAAVGGSDRGDAAGGGGPSRRWAVARPCPGARAWLTAGVSPAARVPVSIVFGVLGLSAGTSAARSAGLVRAISWAGRAVPG